MILKEAYSRPRSSLHDHCLTRNLHATSRNSVAHEKKHRYLVSKANNASCKNLLLTYEPDLFVSFLSWIQEAGNERSLYYEPRFLPWKINLINWF